MHNTDAQARLMAKALNIHMAPDETVAHAVATNLYLAASFTAIATGYLGKDDLYHYAAALRLAAGYAMDAASLRGGPVGDPNA